MTYTRIVYIGTVLVWVLYTYMLFTTPVTESSNRLNISATVLFEIRATIALLYLFIWLAGVFGWSHLRKYSKTIANAPEGPAFGMMTNGLLVLILSFIAATFVGGFRSYHITDPMIVRSTTIIANYLYVLVPLLGFWLLYRGSDRLYSLVPKKFIERKHYLLGTFAVALLSIVYTALILTNPERRVPGAVDTPASFYLSDTLIFLTVIVPALLGWMLGVWSVVNIAGYRKDIVGVVYKIALTKFVYGIMCIIVGSIFLQALLSLGSSRLIGIGLGPLLALIYLFIVILVFGYGFVALGAKKLEQIEKS